MEKVKIRLARETDIDSLFEIRTSVRENHLSRDELAGLGITEDSLRELINARPCAWIAEVGETAVGFAMADRDDACVFAAFIRPQWEGQGTGQRLMACAEAFLFEHHETIWLETAGNSRASGFYSRLGWRPVSTAANGDIRFEKSAPSAR